MIHWAPGELALTPPETSGARVVARLAAARPRGLPLAAFWVAVVAAELVALRPVLWEREAPVQGIEVVLTLVGGSFAACGLVAWRRRPDSGGGMLMAGTGFAYLAVQLLAQVEGELASTVRVLCTDWWIFFFVRADPDAAHGRARAIAARSPAGGLVRAAVGRRTGRVDDVRPGGGRPAARVPRRGRRPRDRPDPARNAGGLLPCHGRVRGRQVVAEHRASAARAAAERRGRVRAAVQRRTARQRPRVRHAIAGAALADGPRVRHRAARVPGRLAALAPRARRPHGPRPAARQHARRGAPGRPETRARRSRARARVRRRARGWGRSHGRADRAQRPPRRHASSTTRRSTTTRSSSRRSRAPPRSRSRTSGCRQSRSSGSRRSGRRASGSSRPGTLSAGGWSATCTTVHSSASSASRCSSGCSRSGSAATSGRRSS